MMEFWVASLTSAWSPAARSCCQRTRRVSGSKPTALFRAAVARQARDSLYEELCLSRSKREKLGGELTDRLNAPFDPALEALPLGFCSPDIAHINQT
jgi:hypothetical protein